MVRNGREEENVRYPVTPEDARSARMGRDPQNERRRNEGNNSSRPISAQSARLRTEENVQYPVRPRRAQDAQVEEDGRYSVTPVTVATPVIQPPGEDPPEAGAEEEVPVHRPRNGDGEGKGERPHFRNRMLLCLLAVAVNWGTTLRIANYFAANVIEVPSLDFVTRTCKTAYNITRDERLKYTKCVENQLDQCNKRLDRTTKREDERVREVTSQNEEVVRRAEEVATNCSRSYRTLRLSLEDWTANGGEIPTASRSACSAEDRERFNRTVLGTQNALALQTEALNTASAYSEESASTVSRLASAVTDMDVEISELNEYIVERVEYDVNYIDRKTQKVRDGLLDVLDAMDSSAVRPFDELWDVYRGVWEGAVDVKACLSLDPDSKMADGGRCEPNLADMVNDFAEDAAWKVEVLTRALYEYRDRMEEYRDNAMEAYATARRYYDGAKAFINAAKSFVFWLNIGDWFDIGDRDFYPLDVEFPDVDLTVEGIGAFESISDMWEEVRPRVAEFFDTVANVENAIYDRFDEVIAGIFGNHSLLVSNLIPDIMPDDYNPPIYVGTFELDINPKEEIALYRNKSEMFMLNTRASLGMFSGTGNQYDEDKLNMDVPTFNITEIKSRITSIDLVFEDLEQPDMDFDLWFVKLSNLSDGFVLVDYIWRAYASIRLLMRYWFATSLSMPNIDLRVNKEKKNPLRMHPARAAVAFVTSPMGGFAIFLASSVWILGIVAALYAPMFYSYKSGCVSAAGNGTFVTKNLFSVSYNHAYQDGSSLLIEGMDAFDLKRGDTCSSRYAASATIQNSMSSNITTYANFHEQMTDSMGLARRCIDSDELDSAFGEACCGLATYPECNLGYSQSSIMCPMDDRRLDMGIPVPYELPGTSLADPSCSASSDEGDWTIENAVFDCEQLGTCSVTCPGPRKGLLRAASERCGCTVEWYLHSKWMSTTFAFLLYVFMNVARVSFFSGITRLLWKYIYSERFTVSATCDSGGSLVTSSKVSGTSHEDLINAIQTSSKTTGGATHNQMSRELHSKLDRALRSFYITGFILLLGSVLANMVWVYALAVTSQTLTPHVWRR